MRVGKRVYTFVAMSLALLLFAPVAPPAATADEEKPPAPHVVDLTASDGTKLKATYYSASQPGPGVLLLHQCNQQRKNWDELAAQLAAVGIHVLTLDYRGYGDSSGDHPNEMDMGAWHKMLTEKWPGDIDQAIEYLEAQPGVTRHILGIGGASCSVNQAIQAASRHPEVRSLVLLSGATDYRGRAFLRKSDKMPILFVASDDDTDSAAALMQWLFTLSKNPGSRYVHYQTGGHGTLLFAVHKGLPGTIVDWYAQTLEKTPGSAPPVQGERPSSSYPPDILEVIDNGGANRIEAKLRALRKNDPGAKLFAEYLVNVIGYEHMEQGDKKGAIEILKLNAYAYPDSANVYDSLSDAYLADGQKELALENAERALKMLPTDTTTSEGMRKEIKSSCEKKIAQLGGKVPQDIAKDKEKRM
jgi:dienelactone hydrolase